MLRTWVRNGLLLMAVFTTSASAANSKDSRTFAVLRFNAKDGEFSTEGRMDPVVSPGKASGHSHGIMGGSNFGLTIEGDQLLDANCTNSMINNDKSNYWVPGIWFQSPQTGKFKKVPLFYMNVYYFFEPTNDEIVPFPPGLKILSGDASKRDPPATASLQLDPSAGPIQPVQFTCPASGDPDRYPPGSDGTKAGMQDPGNHGAGAGFPVINCDGYASPLRQDVHMPSCYNPAAGLDDYQNNMAFPTSHNNKLDCPAGWLHLPHLFYEVYYDTPSFASQFKQYPDFIITPFRTHPSPWTPDGQHQPFVLSNGDRTGYSLHADFVSGWDEATLRTIIDGCNAGTSGMDRCPEISGGVNSDDTCRISSMVPDPSEEWLTALPGDNPVTGW